MQEIVKYALLANTAVRVLQYAPFVLEGCTLTMMASMHPIMDRVTRARSESTALQALRHASSVRRECTTVKLGSRVQVAARRARQGCTMG